MNRAARGVCFGSLSSRATGAGISSVLLTLGRNFCGFCARAAAVLRCSLSRNHHGLLADTSPARKASPLAHHAPSTPGLLLGWCASTGPYVANAMRNAILYAGTIVAVVQIFYLAQLAAQHSEPTIDADAAIAEAFERRPLRAQDYAAPLPQQHDEPARHMRSRTTTPRATHCSRRTKQCRMSPNNTKDVRRATSRADRVEAFVKHIHAKFAPIRPQGFGVRSDPHRASDGKVWETFYEAVESSLNGPYADLAFASPEEVRTDGSIFLSISSFRDEVCPDTLENAFATATSPEKVFVGLVQQNCDQKQHDAYGCKTAVMPTDMRVHDMDADVDCVQAYCARSNAKCDTIRVVRFNESETFGPVFGRISVHSYGKEKPTTCRSTRTLLFARGWDDILREDYALAPSKKAVFSHYPPSGPQKPELPKKDRHPWELSVGPCMCDAEFAEYGIIRVGAMRKYPMKETVGWIARPGVRVVSTSHDMRPSSARASCLRTLLS